MLKKNKYFYLNKKKFLTDGNFIPECKKILYLCSEEDKMQFKFIEGSGDSIIFWADSTEVEFASEIEEEVDIKEQMCFEKIVKK